MGAQVLGPQLNPLTSTKRPLEVTVTPELIALTSENKRKNQISKPV